MFTTIHREQKGHVYHFICSHKPRLFKKNRFRQIWGAIFVVFFLAVYAENDHKVFFDLINREEKTRATETETTMRRLQGAQEKRMM